MNRTLLTVGVFSAGVITGGVATYFGLRKYFSDLANREIQQAYDMLRTGQLVAQGFEDGVKSIGQTKDPEEDDETPTEEFEDEDYRDYDSHRVQYGSYFGQSQKPSLADLQAVREAALAEHEYPEDDEPEDELEEQIREGPQYPDQLDPYVIDEDEYANDPGGNGLETLTYFAGDHTLCDKQESIMPLDIIGDAAIDAFHDGDVDIVYVRNNRVGVNYEVVWDPRSFTEYIYGVDSDDDRARRMRGGRQNDEWK